MSWAFDRGNQACTEDRRTSRESPWYWSCDPCHGFSSIGRGANSYPDVEGPDFADISEARREAVDDQEAEIEAIKLKIDNLLVTAQYRGLPQAATVTYLKELRV
jgi:hypothetical protein